jgi:hypothetical protein
LREAETAVRDGRWDEAERLLREGDLCQFLQQRGVDRESVRKLHQVARRLESSRTLALRGRFAEALEQLAAAAAVRPDLAVIAERQQTCQEQWTRSRSLTEQLHRAMTAGEWTETLTLADQLLEISPQSVLAHDARRQAWLRLGARISDAVRPGGQELDVDPSAKSVADATRPESVADQRNRFLLWVDGVGGFLVCCDEEILLGQVGDGNPLHVPLVADVAPQHARVRRDDGYVLEPISRVRVEGREIRGPRVLKDGDELELGGVRLRFRQPHALSATARLEFLSRHRTQPSADGVLLMAESCVLGPHWQNHVVCRDWSHDVVLYRREGEFYCRALEGLEIDGCYCDGEGRLAGNSHVSGPDFSLTLEALR